MESADSLADCCRIVIHERAAAGTFPCRTSALMLGDDRCDGATDNEF